MVLHFCWMSVNVCERNATGISWLSCSWDSWDLQASSEASTYVHYVALGRVWVVKDRCFQQCTFEGFECCEVTWCPGKLCIIMVKGCQQLCYASKILDELTVVTNKSQKCCYLFSILGGFMRLITAVLEGNGLMPVLLRAWPKYWISLAKKWYLLNFMVNFTSWSLWKTCCRWFRCSSEVSLYIIM